MLAASVNGTFNFRFWLRFVNKDTMDLGKLKNDQKLHLCRWYYRVSVVSIAAVVLQVCQFKNWAILVLLIDGAGTQSKLRSFKTVLEKCYTLAVDFRKDNPGGYFLLPFLWVVNTIWFFNEAFRMPAFDEQQQIRTYVIRSGIGAFLWTAFFVAWVLIFQTYRADWGETADRMSFIIPTGIA